MTRQNINGCLQVRLRSTLRFEAAKLKAGRKLVRRVALAGASATIASDALMNPFDGEFLSALASCIGRPERNMVV